MHAHTPQNNISLEDTEILTTDPRWFERGISSSCAPLPTMGWRSLQTLTSYLKCASRRGGGGGGDLLSVNSCKLYVRVVSELKASYKVSLIRYPKFNIFFHVCVNCY